MITRVKGTQDFLDLRQFNFIIQTIKQHLELHHFHEIATPIIEPTELFKRSLGNETDVVSKEMYILANTAFSSSETTEQEQGESICLRPEATASTMRAFLQGNVTTTPWKAFLWGPMFRRERPQKGRFRQFHQFNLELIGVNSVAQDAATIAMLDRLFTQKFALKDYALAINYMGCAEDRANFKVALLKFLEQHSATICSTCMVRKESNTLRIFDCKSGTCQNLYQSAPKITDHLCQTCAADWTTLKNLLEELSVPYSIVSTLVRGLDYYEKTVFEFISGNLGAQNTFCGGGRYNHLATALGAKEDQPSIGAAIGVERLMLLTEQLPLPELPRLHVVIPFDAEQHALALHVADLLQAHNLCTEVLLEAGSLKHKMRHANKYGAKYVILIGSDEQAAGTVVLKDMMTGTEKKIAQRDLVTELKP